MKDKWYLKTWFICILFFFWFLYGIPLIVGIILLILKLRNDHKLAKDHENVVEQNANYEQQIVSEKSTCTLATPSDLFKISSSVLPPQDNYNILSSDEKKFFTAFYKQLLNANLNPSKIELVRLSNYGFNVDYTGLCYIGKIRLHTPPTQFAVKKNGNKRATKIFLIEKDAKEFAKRDPDYFIETRKPIESTYMQYSIGLLNIKEVSGFDVDTYIDLIPYWIRYINYCKRH